MIKIYGMLGCKKCQSAKEKLIKMGFEEGKDWEYIDATVPALTWRWSDYQKRQDIREAMSAIQLINGHYPAIEINGEVFEYAASMKKLKQILKVRKEKC